jgi:UDPglucose 6-dehydrogenase
VLRDVESELSLLSHQRCEKLNKLHESRTEALPKVSIFGLGKLGASMLAGMAHRGLEVVGVDVSERAVSAVNEGLPPVQETGLAEMIAANRPRIRATMDAQDAIFNSDVTFVIVPTPSDAQGAFSLQYAAHAFKSIGQALKVKSSYHVVVLTSTVLPGATRFGLLPILEGESGKKCGKDFGLCYSPEFIALGTVIRDFLNPDFYLIGEFDKRSGDMLEAVDRIVCEKPEPVCRRMSIENAEIAKVSVNSYVTMKISFANILADICERVPGGDVDVVSDALGTDSRIGRKYLSGGLGFAGPCFPRDNVALNFLGDKLGADTRLLAVNDQYNNSLTDRVVRRVHGLVQRGSTVAVLGLSYKPSSHVIDASQGIQIARLLSDLGYRVVGYDPLAGEMAKQALGDKVIIAETLAMALKNVNAVVVTTRDPEFLGVAAILQAESDEPTRYHVFDCWRYLKSSCAHQSHIDYIQMGVCNNEAESRNVISALWAGSLSNF